MERVRVLGERDLLGTLGPVGEATARSGAVVLGRRLFDVVVTTGLADAVAATAGAAVTRDKLEPAEAVRPREARPSRRHCAASSLIGRVPGAGDGAG
ncbi:hypothetical protein ACIBO5_41425 [Nonomuraea angiospora]|uniref:hypothetical protein n=1 Tax=Nonomuraea angiospora TaxID=46172 RepID=UPI00379AD712